MLRIILWALAIYFLYKVIFDLIIPVFRVSNQMRQKINAFKNEMERQQNGSDEQKQTSKSETAKGGEYIEFEEVKK